MILIDCEATHNFIAQRLVEKLKFPLIGTTHCGVVMGLGEAMKGKVICKVVMISLLEMIVLEDFLIWI